MPRRTNRRFTPALVRSLEPGEHADAACKGLYVRVSPSGSRSYVFRYTSPTTKKSKRKTLAPCETLTLAQARDLVRDLAAQVAAGEDPVAEDRRRREELTVGQLAERYLSEKKLKPASLRTYRSSLKVHILPALGDRPLSTLTRREVQEFHARVATRAKTQAGAAVRLIRAMYSWAINQGILPEDHRNPACKVKIASVAKRRRYLSADERRRFWEALETLETTTRINPYTLKALRLLALTGARRREITALRWSEIDMVEKKITKVEHKTDHHDEVRTIYLSDDAMGLLEELAAARSDSIAWVFPSSTDPGKPVDQISGIWPRLLEVAGLEDLRCHDLRHSYASDGLSRGISLATIGQLLGHRSIVTTQRYAHLVDDAARKAVDEIAAAMGRGEDNVIKMSKKKTS